MSQRVCLGVIIGVHGVKGLVRIKSYTQTDSDIVSYGNLEDTCGNKLHVKIKGRAKSVLLAEVEGVIDRTGAEKLKGEKLFISRDALPVPDDGEFYYADLIGLSVYDNKDVFIGTVNGVHDFGAGELLDVELDGSDKSTLIPFTKECVPVVDLDAKKLTIEPILGLIDDSDENFNGKVTPEKNGEVKSCM